LFSYILLASSNLFTGISLAQYETKDLMPLDINDASQANFMKSIRFNAGAGAPFSAFLDLSSIACNPLCFRALALFLLAEFAGNPIWGSFIVEPVP
jgi:hypothetical protein